ncbi:MAG: helix-hairpin-helix domain-containing protein [Candidatus Promineifilaceae bacterium]
MLTERMREGAASAAILGLALAPQQAEEGFRVPWWAWVLVIALILLVLLIALVRSQAPGPPLPKGGVQPEPPRQRAPAGRRASEMDAAAHAAMDEPMAAGPEPAQALEAAEEVRAEMTTPPPAAPAAEREAPAAEMEPAEPAEEMEVPAEEMEAETAPEREAPAAEMEPVEPAEEMEEPAEEMEAEMAPSAGAADELERVEGIGPAIGRLLRANGITTFSDLAAANSDQLRALLQGANLRMADPTSWPEQARLAAEGRWDELERLQDSLKAGRA